MRITSPSVTDLRKGGVAQLTRALANGLVASGETMLRLSPPGLERFFQRPLLSAAFGGGEADIAVSLAQFGFQSQYITALPNTRLRRRPSGLVDAGVA